MPLSRAIALLNAFIPGLRTLVVATPRKFTRAIFNHLWRDGLRGDSAETLTDVSEYLGIIAADQVINSAEVKSALLEYFEAAIEDKVFGVPTIVVNGHLFWGDDAMPMFEAYIENPEMFATAEMARLENLPVGKHRRASE